MFYNMFYSVKTSQKVAKNVIKRNKSHGELKFFLFIYSELRKSLQKRLKIFWYFQKKQ